MFSQMRQFVWHSIQCSRRASRRRRCCCCRGGRASGCRLGSLFRCVETERTGVTRFIVGSERWCVACIYFRCSLTGRILCFKSCSVEPTDFSCSKLHSSSTAPKLASVRFSRAAYFSSSARISWPTRTLT